ncbi:MAG: zf-HC2 domain-containing protein [Peptococcaceae bacterium]|nr:zf-HC2 domain-containing protein [Peptococcaceae bacterium]
MCYDQGQIQSYIDGELAAAETDELRDHLDACGDCRNMYRRLMENEMLVRSCMEGFLAADRERYDADLAWQKLKLEAVKKKNKNAEGVVQKAMKHRKLFTAAAAVLALAAMFSFGPVRTMAGEFLTVFRVDKMGVIAITPEDMIQMERVMREGAGLIDIRNFGRLEVSGRQEVRPVTLEEAREKAGFELRIPAVAGYGKPDLKMTPGMNVTLTLNVNGVNAALKSLGSAERLPAELDGREFSLDVPPVFTAEYAGTPGKLMLAQSKGPSVRTSAEVDVKVVRKALLSIPALPENLKKQLAAVEDWQHTALIPVKSGQYSEVKINGDDGVYVRGVAQEPGQKPVNALVWQKGGVIYALAGEGLDMGTALNIARTMEKTGIRN